MNKAATLDVIISVRKQFRTEIQRRNREAMDREEELKEIRKALEEVLYTNVSGSLASCQD